MSSIRTRFTISYVLLAVGASLAFVVALALAGTSVAQQQVIDEATAVADRLIGEIRAAKADTTFGAIIDTSGGGLALSTAMRNLLDTKPDYFILIGPDSQRLYNSRLVRMLPPGDGDLVYRNAVALTPREKGGVVALVPLVGDPANPRRLAIVARGATLGGEPRIDRIVAGLPDHDLRLTAGVLFGAALAVLPFIVLAGFAASYFMGARAFQPMGVLTNQLEAITDGRSLHRRLPPDAGNDEVGRLTTTLNSMLARLEVSFGALRRFTADASHELKTPLAVLRVDVERAMHPRTSKDDRLVALEEALQEVTRMSDLVDSLLTLARADEGRFELVYEPIRLDDLLRDVFETATILGETSGLTITMPASVKGTVLGERPRLRQLLLNLITNAIKYTPRGGRVEISSALQGPGEVAIAVRDTGIGIAATDLPHIFDRFWRADRARSRASERSGFGLGLAISQYIAQAHGGTLSVQSRLGRGTLFTVVLPVAYGPDDKSARGSALRSVRTEPVTAPKHGVEAGSDFTDS